MRPSRLGIYSDLIPIVDAALAAAGGSVTFATHGDAVHWRQRFYKFRLQYGREHGTPNKYDALMLRRIPADEAVVHIEVRQATGVFTPYNGPALDDPFDAAAAALAKKLGL